MQTRFRIGQIAKIKRDCDSAIKKGTIVQIRERMRDWYRVIAPDDSFLWVKHDSLAHMNENWY